MNKPRYKEAVWIMAKRGNIGSINLLCVLDDDAAWEYAMKMLKNNLDERECANTTAHVRADKGGS